MDRISTINEMGPRKENEGPHVVLVDDDPVFGRLLQKVAEKERMHLTIISSPREAYRALPTMRFDVGLFDYDLGVVTGIQLCNYLQQEGREVPVLLVSCSEKAEKWKWPASIRKYVSKNVGPYTILTVAREIYRANERKAG